MRFRDRQRGARQRSTLLSVAFLLTVALLVLMVNVGLGGVLWALQGFAADPVFPRYAFFTNTAVTLLFVFGGWWIEADNLGRGAEHLAQRAGARELRPDSYPAEQQLQNIVREIAVSASTPVPTIGVISRCWQINAFAVGLSPRDSYIAVTEGALDELTRSEMQALVAHEMGHIVEGDTRLNTRLVGMVSGLEMLHRFGRSMIRSRDDKPLGVFAAFGFILLVLGWIGWLTGRLLCAAMSRQREYLADARSVQWTRDPQSLVGVLLKARRQVREAEEFADLPQRNVFLRDDDLGEQAQVEHMMIVEPIGSHLARWLSSHPPIEARIRAIHDIAHADDGVARPLL